MKIYEIYESSTGSNPKRIKAMTSLKKVINVCFDIFNDIIWVYQNPKDKPYLQYTIYSKKSNSRNDELEKIGKLKTKEQNMQKIKEEIYKANRENNLKSITFVLKGGLKTWKISTFEVE